MSTLAGVHAEHTRNDDANVNQGADLGPDRSGALRRRLVEGRDRARAAQPHLGRQSAEQRPIVAPDLEESLAHAHAGHGDVQRIHLAMLPHAAEELADHGP